MFFMSVFFFKQKCFMMCFFFYYQWYFSMWRSTGGEGGGVYQQKGFVDFEEGKHVNVKEFSRFALPPCYETTRFFFWFSFEYVACIEPVPSP